MESANLHHHHYQHHHHHHQLQAEEQLHLGSSSSSSSSSSLTTPSLYHEVGIINNSAWNPNLILNNNTGNFNLSGNGGVSNSRDLRQNNNDIHHLHHHHQISPSLSTSMIDQDLGFHWATTTPTSRSSLINDHHSSADSSHELNLAKIKKELSSQYSPSRISEITRINSFSNLDDEYHLASSARNYFKHESELQDLHDLRSSSTTDENKLFLRNLIPSGDHLYYNPQSSTAGFSHHPSKYFSQIFPSMNISSLNPSSSFSSSTTHQPYSDMNNYEALDLLSSSSPSTKIDGSSCFGQTSSSISQSSNNLIGGRQLMKESLSFNHHHYLDHDYDQQIRSSSLSWPFTNNLSKISSSMNLGGREVTTTATKRSSSCSGTSGSTTKASQTAAPKKPRLESRSSFPPIKVRKEKLADRIATLQQLVAPFGKTDTASVLMEATGYIKFLQEQVETLSVPYMKPSIRNNMRSKIQRGSTAGEGETNEPKRDLRSRGLCLVPLSCTSYITNDINFGVNWSSPHYGGARL